MHNDKVGSPAPEEDVVVVVVRADHIYAQVCLYLASCAYVFVQARGHLSGARNVIALCEKREEQHIFLVSIPFVSVCSKTIPSCYDQSF